MKMSSKSLFILFLVSIFSIIINMHFELIVVSELILYLFVAFLISGLVSFAFISEDANYFQNFIFFLSFSILVNTIEPIIKLLLKIL